MLFFMIRGSSRVVVAVACSCSDGRNVVRLAVRARVFVCVCCFSVFSQFFLSRHRPLLIGHDGLQKTSNSAKPEGQLYGPLDDYHESLISPRGFIKHCCVCVGAVLEEWDIEPGV